MGRPRKQPVPRAPLILRHGPHVDNLFQNDDIASFIDDELPALTEERGPKLIARLNVVFDTAEAAARLDALYTADHKKSRLL